MFSWFFILFGISVEIGVDQWVWNLNCFHGISCIRLKKLSTNPHWCDPRQISSSQTVRKTSSSCGLTTCNIWHWLNLVSIFFCFSIQLSPPKPHCFCWFCAIFEFDLIVISVLYDCSLGSVWEYGDFWLASNSKSLLVNTRAGCWGLCCYNSIVKQHPHHNVVTKNIVTASSPPHTTKPKPTRPHTHHTLNFH